MRFSLPSVKWSVAPPSFRLLPSTVSLSEHEVLGRGRKLGGAAENLIDGTSEKRICLLTFEF